MVGICTIEIHIPGSDSLKNKRRVIKSIIQRIRNKYNVSVSEIDEQDIWQRATLGIACISNDKNIIHKTFSHIENFLDSNMEIQVINLYIEIL